MLPRLSLTARLTLFFIGLTVLIVLGLGALFLHLADSHFIELDNMALRDKRALVTRIVVDADTAEEARARLVQALDHQQAIRVQIDDAAGRVVYPPSGSVPVIDTAMATSGSNSAHTLGHVDHFEVSPGFDASAPWHVRLSVDTAFHLQFLRELRRNLAWYALAVMALAGGLAWLAAHQGLAPLRAMKKRAAGVSAQRLDARMPEAAVPVEMADLATELNRMLERLRDDFRRLSEFSSDLAHELRTPISNLLTQTQVMLSTRRDEATYRDTLASNAEELERLARMVSDMLFLAKTERGVDLPNKERFSAAAEVAALAEFHEAVADERQLRLETHGDAAINGDRLMFRRAVSNVLSNALRHAEVRSVVSIKIESADAWVMVRVQNAGAPIPPEVMTRLFDRFYSADPARNHPASAGSGLGLAITRAIVDCHGGKVSVACSLGLTTFSLSFPRAV
ncbi:MAG: heavy metal sensor histidine kinase [Xanthomonadales bacterium]|nr:heavy metal sensor histidine kinase [Xanthomonadales bacterium]